MNTIKPGAGATPGCARCLPKFPLAKDPVSSPKMKVCFPSQLFKSCAVNIHSRDTFEDEFTERLNVAELVSFVLRASGEVDKVMIYRFCKNSLFKFLFFYKTSNGHRNQSYF